ncbi:MAG TPA: hypothetical protein VK165_01990 [Azonexus sp.]|nr:hypothetical protein [Azonexus sp.]
MANERLAELPAITRLLFVYLWMLADREGRIEDRPKRIAALALPYDSEANVDNLLEQLAGTGFITRYTVGDQALIQIDNFAKHQSPHVREAASELPSIEQGITKAVTKHDLGSVEASPRSPDSLIPDSLIPDPLLLIPEQNPCSPSASESADDGFATFWKQYPKKVAKPQAMKAWKKLKPSDQVLIGLMAALEKQKACADWLKDGGQFIPYPATWINSRRWEDEAPAAAIQAPAPTRNPIFAGAV